MGPLDGREDLARRSSRDPELSDVEEGVHHRGVEVLGAVGIGGRLGGERIGRRIPRAADEELARVIEGLGEIIG